MKETLRREINIHRKVLLVDDEPINRQILKVIISNEYDVIQAENGEEALQKIAENQNTISLILLDLLMPKMDGYQLLQKIQETEEYRKIPVIVVTVDKEAEVKCLSLGATDFMPKPYEDPKVIVARCKKAIQLAEDRILINENERDRSLHQALLPSVRKTARPLLPQHAHGCGCNKRQPVPPGKQSLRLGIRRQNTEDDCGRDPAIPGKHRRHSMQMRLGHVLHLLPAYSGSRCLRVRIHLEI